MLASARSIDRNSRDRNSRAGSRLVVASHGGFADDRQTDQRPLPEGKARAAGAAAGARRRAAEQFWRRDEPRDTASAAGEESAASRRPHDVRAPRPGYGNGHVSLSDSPRREVRRQSSKRRPHPADA